MEAALLQHLEALTTFLTDFQAAWDCSVVEIFTSPMWQVFPEAWLQALSKSSDGYLLRLPAGHIKDDWPSSLKDFVATTNRLSLVRNPTAGCFHLFPSLPRGSLSSQNSHTLVTSQAAEPTEPNPLRKNSHRSHETQKTAPDPKLPSQVAQSSMRKPCDPPPLGAGVATPPIASDLDQVQPSAKLPCEPPPLGPGDPNPPVVIDLDHVQTPARTPFKTPPSGPGDATPPVAIDLDHVVAQGMSPKKRHEVAALAALVARVAKEAGAVTVVDVGAGQGYLSHVLYYQYGLDVIAVDAAPGHASVIQKRSGSISKYYRNLRRKARGVARADTSHSPTAPPQNEGTRSKEARSGHVPDCNGNQDRRSSDPTVTGFDYSATLSADLEKIVEKGIPSGGTGFGSTGERQEVVLGATSAYRGMTSLNGETNSANDAATAAITGATSAVPELSQAVRKVTSASEEVTSALSELTSATRQMTSATPDTTSASEAAACGAREVTSARGGVTSARGGVTSAADEDLWEGPIAVTSRIDFDDAAGFLDKLRAEVSKSKGFGREREIGRLLDGPVVLAGLHACGDLSANMLRTFTECPGVKAVVVVSCCYNLATEAPSTVVQNARNPDPVTVSPSDVVRNARSPDPATVTPFSTVQNARNPDSVTVTASDGVRNARSPDPVIGNSSDTVRNTHNPDWVSELPPDTVRNARNPHPVNVPPSDTVQNTHNPDPLIGTPSDTVRNTRNPDSVSDLPHDTVRNARNLSPVTVTPLNAALNGFKPLTVTPSSTTQHVCNSDWVTTNPSVNVRSFEGHVLLTDNAPGGFPIGVGAGLEIPGLRTDPPGVVCGGIGAGLESTGYKEDCPGAISQQRHGFPLSAAVKATGFGGLGINGRMLACQSAARWQSQGESAYRDVILKHTLRAAFQVLLKRHFPTVWASKPVLGKQKMRPVGVAPGTSGGSAADEKAPGNLKPGFTAGCAGECPNCGELSQGGNGTGHGLEMVQDLGLLNPSRSEVDEIPGRVQSGTWTSGPGSEAGQGLVMVQKLVKVNPSRNERFEHVQTGSWTSGPGSDAGCTEDENRRLRHVSKTQQERSDGACLTRAPDPDSSDGRKGLETEGSPKEGVIERARFLDFARQSLQQLKLRELPADDIEAVWESISPFKGLVGPFWTLRTSMAGPLESLILLDRYLYMLESVGSSSADFSGNETVVTTSEKQGNVLPVGEREAMVDMFPLFVPEVSPRNVVIVGRNR